MKYLKLFESFTPDTNIINMVDDILLELDDMRDFVTKSWWDKMVGGDVLVVIIEASDYVINDTTHNDTPLPITINFDARETIKRLMDFMISQGYEYKLEFGTDNIPPGTPKSEINDYYRVLYMEDAYKELDDSNMQLWVDEYIRLDFTKEDQD